MIICADDYGLAEDIDSAILQLCSEGRLTAASCMVVLERCSPPALSRLLAFDGKVDIGLHFCLTSENLPLSRWPSGENASAPMPSFRVLFRSSLMRRLNRNEIRNQLAAQYELFLKKCNRPPDFIDGHLHIHQLPGVREEVVAFARNLPERSRPYIRNTYLQLKLLRARGLPWLKAAFIGAFGKRMKHLLENAGLETNPGFAGIYDFADWSRYETYLPGFISCLQSANGLLVTHPGTREKWRQQEFINLRKAAFNQPPKRFQREKL